MLTAGIKASGTTTTHNMTAGTISLAGAIGARPAIKGLLIRWFGSTELCC